MNYHTDDWICKRVGEHYQEAVASSPERGVLGVFLRGSQNYGLDFETSDVDTVCLVLPSRDDLVKGNPPYSHEHHRTNGEHIVFWDVRHFLNLLEKGGFNQLEILYTKYYQLNEEYRSFWEDCVLSNREELKKLNPRRTVNSFLGMIQRCVSEIAKKQDNSACYQKEYMRVKFFCNAVEAYLSGTDMSEILLPSNSEELKAYRRTSLSYSDVLKDAANSSIRVKEMVRSYSFPDPVEDSREISAVRDALFEVLVSKESQGSCFYNTEWQERKPESVPSCFS